MSNPAFFNITGYLTLSKSFIKNYSKEDFFALHVYKGNDDFKIDSGAYLLCKLSKDAKSGDLVIGEEIMMGEAFYSVYRYRQGRGYVWLENSSGKKIMDTDWKPFGKVQKVFNMPTNPAPSQGEEQ